jgi:gamma-glutamyltranspeptidase/glutathione hydrolase
MKAMIAIKKYIPLKGCLSPITILLVLGILSFIIPNSVFSAQRGIVMGRNGMVASIHPLASKVGIDILEKGGTAADAAIAMISVLHIVEPPMSGLGGDAMILYYSAKDKKVYGLNSSGRSPYNSSLEWFIKNGHKKMPRKGIHTVTVPGAFYGWTMLHERFWTMELSSLFEPAIRYAEEGIPVNEWLYKWYKIIKLEDPVAVSTYYINGRIPKLGEVLVQKNLAETYRKLGKGGRDLFYKGEIAEEIVRLSKSKGGFLTMKDFADHKSEWVEPIRINYRGYEVLGFPPNTQGLALLLQLNVLNNFDLATMKHNSVQAIHTMVEAKRLAFADRNHFIADPATTDIPLNKLLSEEYADKRAKLINPNKAASQVAPGDPNSLNTTYFNVADKYGNAVSFINSLKSPWGSRLVAGQTGFLLQNRGNGFTLDPEHVNRFAPHKRPFHTINPAMVLKDGKPYMLLGCAGGDAQTQAMTQVITNIIDFGMNIQDAIEAKRWTHLKGAKMTVEYDLSDQDRQALTEMGYEVVPKKTRGVYWGDCQCTMIDQETGTLFGGSESRAAGAALGY